MFILGKKLKMSQVWKGEKVIPVTIIKATPNKVTLLRTKRKDKYEAVQIAMGKKKREFKISGEAPFKMGDEIDVTAFAEGDKVRITGWSKGRGFQGVVKRHGFHGGPKTHGQKNRFRAPGSIGSTAFQRVVPGRKMAGHMGTARITIKRTEVIGVDKENNTISIKGQVPGAPGGFLQISKTT